MAIIIRPQIQQDPVRSPLGGVTQGVEPFRDYTGQQMQQVGEIAGTLGGAAVGVASTLQQQENEAQAKIDIARSAEAEATFDEEVSRYVDGPEGFTSLLGAAAVGDRVGPGAMEVGSARRKTFEQVRQAQDRIAKGLANETQRRNFALQANRIVAAANGRADTHQRRQAAVYAAGASEARQQRLRREAVDAETADAHAIAKLTLLEEVETAGNALGAGPDQLAAMRMEATTALYRDRANRLVTAGRSAQARQELEGFADQIESRTLDDLRNLARNGSVQDDAANLSRRIIYSAVAPVEVEGVAFEVGTWSDEQRVAQGQERQGFREPIPVEQLAVIAARAVDAGLAGGHISAAVAKQTMQNVNAHIEQQTAARANAAKAALARAQAEAEAVRAKDVEALSPATREALTKTGTAGTVQQWLQRGQQYVTTGAGENLMTLATADPSVLTQRFRTPAELLIGTRDVLSDTDQQKAAALWRAARGEASQAEQTLIDENMLLRDVARQANILPADGRDANDEQAAAFERFTLAAKRKALADSKDGKPLSADLRAAADAIALDSMSVGGKPVPFLSMTRAEQNAGSFTTSRGRTVYLRNVSEAEREQVLEGIQMFNREARRRNATLPPDRQIQLKPETMQSIVEEWDAQQAQQTQQFWSAPAPLQNTAPGALVPENVRQQMLRTMPGGVR